ncbi:hypothetical protein [Paracoccus sp. MC1854]|uniref:hypothetical protein n=1 Tax=Paracoccus sp. MC1854 TaxID=2760306 RepID=UPI001C71DF7B|nr:hypothetical protein [Paracoccus sp. MC1854]
MVGPFSRMGDDAVAIWQVYTGQLDPHAEHAVTHLPGLWMHGPRLIHTGKVRIGTPTDFAGLKLSVSVGNVRDLLEALCATPLFMPAPVIYEKLSRGVIDGGAFGYDSVTAFNLTNHVRYAMRVPGHGNERGPLGRDFRGRPRRHRGAVRRGAGPPQGRGLERRRRRHDRSDDLGRDRDPRCLGPIAARVDEIAGRLESEWIARIGAGHDAGAALADYPAQTAAAQ